MTPLDLRVFVNQLLGSLSSQERIVVSHRAEGATLRECGDAIGRSGERARAILARIQRRFAISWEREAVPKKTAVDPFAVDGWRASGDQFLADEHLKMAPGMKVPRILRSRDKAKWGVELSVYGSGIVAWGESLPGEPLPEFLRRVVGDLVEKKWVEWA